MGLFRSSAEKQLAGEAETALRTFAVEVMTSDPNRTRELATAITPKLAALPDQQRKKLGQDAFLRYADNALADDHLTEDEEDALAAVAEAMGFEQDDFERSGIYPRLQVAKVNDGRLPTVSEPNLIAKQGEVVHLEASAALLKEVTQREFRAGSQGFSFRVAKGVRYRVGSTRGRLVTVGTIDSQVADTGLLSVTNRRVVFLGDRKTIDMPYAKLAGMHLFSDAISFSLSNRQNAPLIRVAMNIDVLGALLNAAVQASND